MNIEQVTSNNGQNFEPKNNLRVGATLGK